MFSVEETMTVGTQCSFKMSEGFNQIEWRHIITEVTINVIEITEDRPLRYSTTVSISVVIYRAKDLHWCYDDRLLSSSTCTSGGVNSSFIYCKFTLYVYVLGPPLWSSGQSSWLLTQRSRVRFSALPDFLRSSGSGTGSTQPREDK
jgi:hypothetical protein